MAARASWGWWRAIRDEVNRLLACNTHDSLLFFTTRGRAYQLKVYELPATGRQARGVPVNNLISVEPGETVAAVLVMPRERAAQRLR